MLLSKLNLVAKHYFVVLYYNKLLINYCVETRREGSMSNNFQLVLNTLWYELRLADYFNFKMEKQILKIFVPDEMICPEARVSTNY